MSEHSQDTTVSSQPLQHIPLTDQKPPGQSASTETQDHETPVLLCTTDLSSNVPVDASEQSGYPQVIQAATSLHVAPVQQQSAYPHLATSTQMIPSPRQSDRLQVTSSAQMAQAPTQNVCTTARFLCPNN